MIKLLVSLRKAREDVVADLVLGSGCLEVKALHECYGPEAQRGFFHTSTNVPFVIMLISGNASKRTDIDMYPLSRNYTAQ